MTDQLKLLCGGFAYQTTGSGTTSSSNTGGLLSGGAIATVYTAPTATSVIIRDVYISCWAGTFSPATPPDSFLLVYYRFSNLAAWNYKTFSSQTISTNTGKVHDTGLYIMNPADTLQVLIQASSTLPANPLLPTPNTNNNSSMYENIGFLCYGVETK